MRVALLLCLTLACDAGPGSESELADSAPASCAEQPASVRVGGSGLDAVGRPVWTEMPEGSQQIMVHGPQGGWHFLASADVQSTHDIVTLDYRVSWPAREGAEVSFGSFRVMLVPDDRCGGYYAGMLGVLDVSELVNGESDTPPEVLAGETLTIAMNVVDFDGLTAADSVNVIAALDPADAAAP